MTSHSHNSIFKGGGVKFLGKWKASSCNLQIGKEGKRLLLRGSSSIFECSWNGLLARFPNTVLQIFLSAVHLQLIYGFQFVVMLAYDIKLLDCNVGGTSQSPVPLMYTLY